MTNNKDLFEKKKAISVLMQQDFAHDEEDVASVPVIVTGFFRLIRKGQKECLWALHETLASLQCHEYLKGLVDEELLSSLVELQMTVQEPYITHENRLIKSPKLRRHFVDLSIQNACFVTSGFVKKLMTKMTRRKRETPERMKVTKSKMAKRTEKKELTVGEREESAAMFVLLIATMFCWTEIEPLKHLIKSYPTTKTEFKSVMRTLCHYACKFATRARLVKIDQNPKLFHGVLLDYLSIVLQKWKIIDPKSQPDHKYTPPLSRMCSSWCFMSPGASDRLGYYPCSNEDEECKDAIGYLTQNIDEKEHKQAVTCFDEFLCTAHGELLRKNVPESPRVHPFKYIAGHQKSLNRVVMPQLQSPTPSLPVSDSSPAAGGLEFLEVFGASIGGGAGSAQMTVSSDNFAPLKLEMMDMDMMEIDDFF